MQCSAQLLEIFSFADSANSLVCTCTLYNIDGTLLMQSSYVVHNVEH